MNMNLDTLDWKALERMRTAFLAGTAGATDYWQSEADLAAYDASFAQRIGWKWDYVLAELKRRGWSPPAGELLDWGCGSGIAGRAFLDYFGADSVAGLRLWDRSPLAMSFAAQRAREKFPGLNVVAGLNAETEVAATRASPPRDSVLLISHVLTELTPEQVEALADLAAEAASVIWVEPGTYEASLTLIAIRERLRERLNVIAPCTHAGRCGILAPGNERHWCHHFATPPPEVFTDGDWSRFANLLGIDLRDLPLSFLVLDARPAQVLPPGAARVIGHPRIYKGHALLLGCEAAGVRERKLTRRKFPDEFRALKKGEADVLQEWQCDGDEIVVTKPLFR
jgi:ribosomal protein RSM22 (predicted rRNA methylase)